MITSSKSRTNTTKREHKRVLAAKVEFIEEDEMKRVKDLDNYVRGYYNEMERSEAIIPVKSHNILESKINHIILFPSVSN